MAKGIMLAYFLVITVLYPFYAPGGYLQIGEVKFVFFRNVTFVMLAMIPAVILVSVLRSHRTGWIAEQYRSMSISDWFAYGYFLVIMVSYLCSDYKADALWGMNGWHMGAITQIMFVLLYFLMSRYLSCEGRWLAIWLMAAAAAFLMGILNRYSVYPIAMAGQTGTFISTLGNINWFSGYWSVTAPIGMTWYWGSRPGWGRVASGIFTVIAMLAGVTQGSSSVYLVFAVVYAVLLLLSIRDNRRIYRFLELCMLFAVSCQLGRIMCHIPGLYYNYGNDVYPMGSWIAELLLDGNATLWLLAGMAGLYAVILVTKDRRGRLAEKLFVEKYANIRKNVNILLAVMMTVLVVICLLRSGMLQEKEVTNGQNTYGRDTYSWETEVFRPDWGNGRGAAWNCGISAYRKMNGLQKMVGIGSDCFADYVYEVPQLAERLTEQFGNQRLTNAHNEWLTILVNTGALGLLCYVGLWAAVVIRCLKMACKLSLTDGKSEMTDQTGADIQVLLYACAISLLAYTAHNMVSFQQILSTPYFFILLGMGEGLVRRLQNPCMKEHMKRDYE